MSDTENNVKIIAKTEEEFAEIKGALTKLSDSLKAKMDTAEKTFYLMFTLRQVYEQKYTMTLPKTGITQITRSKPDDTDKDEVLIYHDDYIIKIPIGRKTVMEYNFR